MTNEQEPDEEWVPLGTDPAIFWHREECLIVPFFPATHVEFDFEDEDDAATTCLRLQQALENAVELSAVELRDCYSPENLMEFLSGHLDRTRVVAVRWVTSLRVDEAGISCVLPTGEWTDVHIEDVYEPTFPDPPTTPKITSELSRSADYAYRRFQLDRRYVHVGRGRVSRSPEEFFGETDS